MSSEWPSRLTIAKKNVACSGAKYRELEKTHLITNI